ncbi:ornithine cyclodeaminase family protein [uncultured Bartonella sp.]|uniref:ornithine cyclodeaminase family protein n=1 Tax=uncultured Bartonella sp. TaxID=104108 RepID=UPI0025F73CE8|nr:ornithine cyclodeaminase family protein [uncultured Bartonella sp.]
MDRVNANKHETADALPFKELIDALDKGFATGCAKPERQHLKLGKQENNPPIMLLMPAWTNSETGHQFLGVKIVNVFPDNRLKNLPGLTSTYILYDGDTGEELAIFDGNTLTARRTAATSALAARYLSSPQSEKLAIIGAGEVAQLLADAFSAVRSIKKISIWNRTKKSAEKLGKQLEDAGFSVTIADTAEEAVNEADIISAATLSNEPVIQKNWVKKGAHVDLIGAFTPQMREADDDLVRHAKLYIDTAEALEEAGDLCIPIGNGTIKKGDILATLSDLALSKEPPERGNDDITLFKAVGSALADLYAAKLAFETLSERRRGEKNIREEKI